MRKNAGLIALILVLMTLSLLAGVLVADVLPLAERPPPQLAGLPLPEQIRQQAFENCLDQLRVLELDPRAKLAVFPLEALGEYTRLYSMCDKARERAAIMPTRTPVPRMLLRWRK